MRKIVYLTGVLAICFFIISGAFKLLQLIGAPLLLILSTFFACLFVISLAIYKFKDRN
ncbi:MAG: hypothetical protein ACJZZ7_04050 [Cytophagales bacterium]